MHYQVLTLKLITAKTPETWYDIYEDFGLIEASFNQQYGIRLRQNLDMSFDEFTTLLAGLLPDTPLGKVVALRSEDDKDILKQYSKSMLDERRKWRNRNAQKKLDNVNDLEKTFDAFQRIFEKLYS